MLANLIDNAIRYGRTPGHIAVRCLADGEDAVVQIDDDGPGIPPAIGDHLFDRGARADQAQEGQGIGLAVVRDIVRVYGGTVTLGRGKALGGAEVSVNL
jgi:signal transduction histidine kinase